MQSEDLAEADEQGKAESETSALDVVDRAIAGDEEAVSTLFDEHYPSIFRFLWSRVGDRTVAQDLAGETFLRMVAALPDYEQRGLPFRAWLFRIARNLLIDHYRKSDAKQEIPLEDAELRDRRAGPAAELDELAAAENLQRALSDLTESQREVVALRFLSDLSLKETATAVNKSVAAVKALQHRGLGALRDVLSGEMDG